VTSEELATEIEKVLADKKGINVLSYDSRTKSDIADFFIVATATSTPHLRALLNEIRTSFKNTTSFLLSGTPESGWIVVDCYDVIVHLFLSELRSYYAIDELLSKIAS
jgi:ribosome-associated protein